MLKKLFLISTLAIFMFVGVANAQTNELPDAGILPGSPFYFLKSTSEGIGTFFSFGKVAKAERYAFLANKRLAEAEELASAGNSERAEKATEKYQERIARALERAEEAKMEGKDVDEILAKVAEATLKHQEVLARVYEQVPEQAKEAIKHAMERSVQGHDEALKAISGERRNEIEDMIEGLKHEVEVRLEELRERGVPIPELRDREEREEEIKMDKEHDEMEDIDDNEMEDMHDDEMEDMHDDEMEDMHDQDDNMNEQMREEAKNDAEEIQEALEKALENSDLTEAEREVIKQAGEKAREEIKQRAEEEDRETE